MGKESITSYTHIYRSFRQGSSEVSQHHLSQRFDFLLSSKANSTSHWGARLGELCASWSRAVINRTFSCREFRVRTKSPISTVHITSTVASVIDRVVNITFHTRSICCSWSECEIDSTSISVGIEVPFLGITSFIQHPRICISNCYRSRFSFVKLLGLLIYRCRLKGSEILISNDPCQIRKCPTCGIYWYNCSKLGFTTHASKIYHNSSALCPIVNHTLWFFSSTRVTLNPVTFSSTEECHLLS